MKTKLITLTLREYLIIIGGMSVSSIGNVLFIIWIARLI
jgi:hypothetical protein